MPRADQFINNFHPDEEFLDENQLLGHVYTMIIRIGLTENKAKRHHMTLHLITDIINSVRPSCKVCGNMLADQLCDDCKGRAQGITRLII